jgi:hypothetical protein
MALYSVFFLFYALKSPTFNRGSARCDFDVDHLARIKNIFTGVRYR